MYSRCTLLVVFKIVFQETLVSLEAYQLYPNQKISNGMIPHMKKTVWDDLPTPMGILEAVVTKHLEHARLGKSYFRIYS